MKKLGRKKSLLLVLALVGAFCVAVPSGMAAGVSPVVTVEKNQIIDGNFVRAGSTIIIDGNVKGDVIVAGNSITITGAVAGDVIAAGNLVRVLGPVSGSVRVVGSTIEISGEIERNVWAVGNIITINPGASVGWDVYAAGATLELKAPVGGNVIAAGAGMTIDSSVGKNVQASLDDEGQLVLGPLANITGTITYHANNDGQLVTREGAVVTGEVLRKEIEASEFRGFGAALAGAWVFIKIISLFSALVVGIVLVSLVPKFVLEVHGGMTAFSKRSLGWGAITLLLTPIVLVALCMTVIGIPFALIGFVLYLIALYVAKVLASFAIGLYVLNKVSSDKKYSGSLVWPLVLGVILFIILGSVPIIGWLFAVVATVWALGSTIYVMKGIVAEYR